MVRVSKCENISKNPTFLNITKWVDDGPTVGIIYVDSERFQRNSTYNIPAGDGDHFVLNGRFKTLFMMV